MLPPIDVVFVFPNVEGVLIEIEPLLSASRSPPLPDFVLVATTLDGLPGFFPVLAIFINSIILLYSFRISWSVIDDKPVF